MNIKTKNNNNLSHWIIAILIIALIAIICMVAYNKYTNTTNRETDNNLTTVVNNENKNNNSSHGIISPKDSSSYENSVNIDSSVTPSAPIGSFVSNHKPNLSGHPAPNTEASTCTTTPGALCTIAFSMNGVEKQLPKKAVDNFGNTSWNWNLQEMGLTEGTWTVTAIATNGDKISKSIDAINLTINE